MEKQTEYKSLMLPVEQLYRTKKNDNNEPYRTQDTKKFDKKTKEFLKSLGLDVPEDEDDRKLKGLYFGGLSANNNYSRAIPATHNMPQHGLIMPRAPQQTYNSRQPMISPHANYTTGNMITVQYKSAEGQTYQIGFNALGSDREATLYQALSGLYGLMMIDAYSKSQGKSTKSAQSKSGK